MFEFNYDLNLLIKTMDMSIHELADELHFDVPTISNWLNGKYLPDPRSKEDVYDYAFKNNIKINLSYDYGLRQLAKRDGFAVL